MSALIMGRDMGLPAAVLWDMDGTVVDSEPYWIAAEHALVASHGGVWTDELAHTLVGQSLLVSAQMIKDATGIALEPIEITHALLDAVTDRMREQVPWRPGARELLAELNLQGVPCALVTASWRRFVDAFLEGAPRGSFQAVVTGDMVGEGKPHPEPYLTAARLLGVDPAACIALEDSVPGVTSALAAGVPTIGIVHLIPLPERPGLTLIDTLAGVSGHDLVALTRR